MSKADPRTHEIKLIAADLFNAMDRLPRGVDETPFGALVQRLLALASEPPAAEKCQACDGSGTVEYMVAGGRSLRPCPDCRPSAARREPPAVEGVTPMSGEEIEHILWEEIGSDGYGGIEGYDKAAKRVADRIAADHARLSAGRGAPDGWREAVERYRKEAQTNDVEHMLDAIIADLASAAPPPPQDHSGAPGDEGLRERCERLERALAFYRDNWTFKEPKWWPTPELSADCGNRATAALALTSAPRDGGADADHHD